MMNKYIALIKREYWENKALFIAFPVVFAGLVLIAALAFVATIYFGHGGSVVSSVSDITFIPKGEIALILYMSSMPFALILWLVALYYYTSCLSRDRKDGSAFFWQSLPITQAESISAKLMAGLIYMPLITLACLIALQLILMVIASFIFPLVGLQVLTPFLWQPLAMLKGWLMVLTAFYVQAIWMLPLLGWFMLCSAALNRAVILFSSLPILFLEFIQKIFHAKIYFLSVFTNSFAHLTQTWNYFMELLNWFADAGTLEYQQGQLIVQKPALHLSSFFSIDMVWGVIACVILLVAAGYLRKRCFGYEG